MGPETGSHQDRVLTWAPRSRGRVRCVTPTNGGSGQSRWISVGPVAHQRMARAADVRLTANDGAGPPLPAGSRRLDNTDEGIETNASEQQSPPWLHAGIFVDRNVGAPTELDDRIISNTDACIQRDAPGVTWATSITTHQDRSAACQGNDRLGTLTDRQGFEPEQARQRRAEHGTPKERPMARRKQRSAGLPPTGFDAVVANLIADGIGAPPTTASAAPWRGCRTNAPRRPLPETRQRAGP